jgi:hypothetical protein
MTSRSEACVITGSALRAASVAAMLITMAAAADTKISKAFLPFSADALLDVILHLASRDESVPSITRTVLMPSLIQTRPASLFEIKVYRPERGAV